VNIAKTGNDKVGDADENKSLSYRREIALQAGLVIAKRLELREYFTDIIGLPLTTVT